MSENLLETTDIDLLSDEELFVKPKTQTKTR
jgi:hypothetical protein